ncbi:MAG: mechanosensitive ion channel family protein [Anaerolineae bacterium]|nr:mechanosensitive ion channel family protein [Anaerolineae bacterium]
MNLTDIWNQIPESFRENVARVLLALLAFVLIWLLRRLLARVVVVPLRALAKRSNATWDEVVLDIVTVPARLLIIAFGLLVGAEILRVDLGTSVFIVHLARTLIIIAVLTAAYRVVDALAPSSNRLFRMTGLTINERLLPFARTATKLILIAVALVIVLQEWGYDVSGLVAGLGLGGLAFSLAAKDTVENLFGFTTIVGDQPFIVGEYIKTPDVEGTVEHVGIRSTRIRQPDQAYVIIPNSKLASAPILNWARLSKRWYNMTLRVTYDASRQDIMKLMEQIKVMLEARELVQADTIVVNFVNFGDFGFEILVRAYIDLPNWGEFTREKEVINLEIMRIFEELGLKIAFPARPMYVPPAS